jgi:hypothetical protein
MCLLDRLPLAQRQLQGNWFAAAALLVEAQA